MFIPGHVATAVLAAAGVSRMRGRRPRFWAVLVPAALGGLTPDLLDKSIMALGGSIYGRTVGHSLVFLGAAFSLWAGAESVRRALRWRVRARARPGARAGRGGPAATAMAGPLPARLTTVAGFWVLGVASHLAADLLDDAVRSQLRGGIAVASWFAWPFATPYTWVIQNREPLGVWPWRVTPVEVVLVAAVVVWGAWWLRARGARAR